MRPPAVRRERVRFRPSGMVRSGRRSAAHEKLSSGGPAAESGKGADARLGMTLRWRKGQEILMRKAVPGTAERCRRGASFETEPMLCGSRNAEKLPQCGRSPKREKLLWQRGAACKNERSAALDPRRGGEGFSGDGGAVRHGGHRSPAAGCARAERSLPMRLRPGEIGGIVLHVRDLCGILNADIIFRIGGVDLPHFANLPALPSNS